MSASVSSASFNIRQIDIKFTLTGGATFDGSGGANQVTLTGRRIEAEVEKNGQANMGIATFRVYGMTFSQMNQLSTLGKPPGTFTPNEVYLLAGNPQDGKSTVFAGSVISAWIDFNGMPDVAFQVQAGGMIGPATASAAPTSYTGNVPAATVLGDLATRSNLSFQNDGVTTILTNPYYHGDLWGQIKDCCKEARCMYDANDNGALCIWPVGGSKNSVIPLISPGTGMIGYPTFFPTGIIVRTMFNPSIRNGSFIQVQSALKQATGKWQVLNLSYAIASEVPDGPWEQRMECVPPGYIPSDQ